MHNETAEKDYFRGVWRGLKIHSRFSCSEFSKVLVGGLEGAWQAKKSQDSQESPCLFPGDVMDDVEECDESAC